MSLAGSRPGGRPPFLLVQERRQRTRPQVCDPFAALRGKPVSGRLRGVPQNSLRAGALRSNNCGKSDNDACALRCACSPRKRPAPGAATGGEQPGTGHRCARPRASAAPDRGERSDGPCCWVPFWPGIIGVRFELNFDSSACWYCVSSSFF